MLCPQNYIAFYITDIIVSRKQIVIQATCIYARNVHWPDMNTSKDTLIEISQCAVMLRDLTYISLIAMALYRLRD